MLKDKDLVLLKSIIENKFDFKNVKLLELTELLLNNIGDVDPVLRDEIVYPVLAHLLHDNVLEKEKLVEIAKRLISNDYLLFDMNNLVENSVLKRTFTLLQLAILVYKHNTDESLNEDIFD